MEGEGEREGQGIGECDKTYHNFNYKVSNKLIEEGQQYIFGGTNQLYYKEFFLENIPRR